MQGKNQQGGRKCINGRIETKEKAYGIGDGKRDRKKGNKKKDTKECRKQGKETGAGKIKSNKEKQGERKGNKG